MNIIFDFNFLLIVCYPLCVQLLQYYIYFCSGSFVDEYVGEVIDQHEMIKRMKTKLYMNNNYMVQLKHDEIIDATRKGNITRFINHSCEPNCVAEKV